MPDIPECPFCHLDEGRVFHRGGSAVALWDAFPVIEFQKWQGEKPITVWWVLKNPVPERFWKNLKVPA